MRVSRLPQDPGVSGWPALLPDLPMAQRLQDDISAEYLIIGAGFAGLAAARRLRQLRPGARIVVLEALRVCEGPAGSNSGFLIVLPHDLSSQDYGGDLAADQDTTRDNRHAIAFAAQMAAEFNLPAEALVRSGKINAAATDKGAQHNADYARHLTGMGEESTLLDAAQMRGITGTGYYQGGLFTPGTAMIQPAMFVRGVAEGLRGCDIAIYENSPVLALDRQGGWQAVTPHGRVRADRVILAVNGHLGSFGFHRRRLMHVFTYASMTRALQAAEVAALGGQARWGVTPADPMGTTVRRISGQGGARIVVRNRFTYDPAMTVSARGC